MIRKFLLACAMVVLPVANVIAADFDQRHTLVVYFSLIENRIPAINNDSFENKNSGNSQNIARLIAKNVNGDIYSLEVVNKYGTEYNDVTARAVQERNDNARPRLKSLPDVSAYDTIFVVYPIWGGLYPRAVASFLDNTNLENKTIIPAATHGGSGLSRSIAELKHTLTKSRVIEDGFDLLGSHAHDSNVEELIQNYLQNLSL